MADNQQPGPYSIFDLGFDKSIARGNPMMSLNQSAYMQLNPLYGQFGASPNVSDQITSGLSDGSSFLPDGMAGGTVPTSVMTGEITSLLFTGKKNFTDTTNGWIQGIDTDGTYKWLIGGSTSSIDWNVTTANTLTVTGVGIVSPTISYGKTSFTDSTHAGFYLSSAGVYIGAAADATAFKYTVATGAFDFIGTISSRSTVTVAAAINSSGNLITDVINTKLNTSARTILLDFSFGATNYAGAVNSGNITWNTATGAITGGSGVILYRSGILGVNAGVTTFSIDSATGAATFAGALSAPTGNIGGFTIGATTISATNLSLTSGVANTANITVGTGATAGGLNSASGSTDIVFWGGSSFANRATAPFRVTAAGDTTVNSVSSTISAAIAAIVAKTTGEAIDGSSTPQVVCVKASDSKIYKADANDTTRVHAIGFLTSNSGNNVSANVLVSGTVSGFSGLTEGAMYYVTDTAGSIDTIPSTSCQIPIGRAVTTTTIEIFIGKKVSVGNSSSTANTVVGTTTDTAVTVGFKPAYIDVSFELAESDSGSNGNGIGAGVWINTSTSFQGGFYSKALSSGTTSDVLYTLDNVASAVSKPSSPNSRTSTLSFVSWDTSGFTWRNVTSSGSSTSGITIFYRAYE